MCCYERTFDQCFYTECVVEASTLCGHSEYWWSCTRFVVVDGGDESLAVNGQAVLAPAEHLRSSKPFTYAARMLRERVGVKRRVILRRHTAKAEWTVEARNITWRCNSRPMQSVVMLLLWRNVSGCTVEQNAAKTNRAARNQQIASILLWLFIQSHVSLLTHRQMSARNFRLL